MWTRRRARRPGSAPPIDGFTLRALRSALERIETPAPSPDFDSRVLAAVRGRDPWWELALSYFRPALATAAVSAAVTILLLQLPVGTPALAAAPPSLRPEAGADARLQRMLSAPNPTYLAFTRFRAASTPAGKD